MLQYITDERYIENRPEQVKNVKIAVENNVVPRLVDFLDPTFGNPLTMFHAANALKNFISVSDEASIQIYKAGGLKKCLHLMSRRECHKMYMDYYKETFLGNSDVDKDEEEIMRKFYTGKITFFKRIERYPMLTEYDHRKECLMYMASQTQENCALVTYKVCIKFE